MCWLVIVGVRVGGLVVVQVVRGSEIESDSFVELPVGCCECGLCLGMESVSGSGCVTVDGSNAHFARADASDAAEAGDGFGLRYADIHRDYAV